MELRRRSNKIIDILTEFISASADYINRLKTKMPKDLVNNYSTKGVFYGFNYKGIGTIDGFRVVKATSLMKNSYIYYGGVYTDFPTEGGKYTNTAITIDINFDTLSTNTKRFVLYHEVGHLKDPRGFEVLQEEAFTRGLEENFISDGEKIADDYAVSIVGKKNSVKALKEILSQIEGTFLNTGELEERIKRIKEEL